MREDDPPLSRRHCFDRDPDGYAVGRPPYPARVYEILEWCGLGPGSRVLEIGPGTGLATAPLLSRGADVVAVEPGRGLAAALRERLDTDRLAVIEADLEHAELPAGPYDLAVAATSFHWVDTSVALPKLAALLRPKGWLVVWWNVFADPHRPTAFRAALDRHYERHLPGERRGPGRHSEPGPLGVGSWSAELRRGGWFGEVTAELIPWTHRITAEDARRLWSTFPNVMELPQPARAAFLADLAATVEDFGGAVDDPYVTAVYRTRPVART